VGDPIRTSKERKSGTHGTLLTNKSKYNSKIVLSSGEKDMRGGKSTSNRQQKKKEDFGRRTHRMQKYIKGHLLHPTCSIYLKVSSSIVYTSYSQSFYPQREASCSRGELLSPGLHPSRVHRNTAEVKISRSRPSRKYV